MREKRRRTSAQLAAELAERNGIKFLSFQSVYATAIMAGGILTKLIKNHAKVGRIGII